MKAREELSLLRSTRKRVEEIQELLARPTPEALSGCLPRLKEALVGLSVLDTKLREEVGPGVRPALKLEVALLRREVSRIQALLENAGAFYRARGAMLAAGTIDYSRACAPAGGSGSPSMVVLDL